MKILGLQQGAPSWLAARASYFCSSDASAMMGVGHVSRTDLVRMKANGDEQEFSQYVRDIVIEPGHEIEALARPIVEAKLGVTFYPVTAVDDTDTYLASFDGLTMDEETSWECKRWNEADAAEIRAGEVPEKHRWQLEHQRLVNPGLKRQLFTMSDGTPENTLTVEYRTAEGRREKLIAGWKQFEEDVRNYVHVESPSKPAATLEAALPAVAIEVKGHVDLASNLQPWGERLRSFIAQIPKQPATDEEFANCEAAVKALKTAEERLELAESTALAKFESLDALRTEVAMLRELARATRLAVDKLVEERKKQIRDEIRQEGIRALSTHVTKLNQRLGRPLMPAVAADFAGKMKGKKSIASLRDAVATELARAKIEANEVADKIEANLKALAEHAAGSDFLFHDLASLLLKAPDDFVLVVKSRVSEHRVAEEKRLAAQREAIAKEEAAKAEARIRAEQEARQAPQPAPTQAARPVAVAKSRPTDEEIIGALALHYHVSTTTVIAWLVQMDLESASQVAA